MKNTKRDIDSISGFRVEKRGDKTLGLYLIYRTIRAQFDRCTKICGVFAINTLSRKICMSKCNYLKAKKIFESLRKYGGTEKNIKKAEAKLIKAKDKFEHYQILAKQYKKTQIQKLI